MAIAFLKPGSNAYKADVRKPKGLIRLIRVLLVLLVLSVSEVFRCVSQSYYVRRSTLVIRK